MRAGLVLLLLAAAVAALALLVRSRARGEAEAVEPRTGAPAVAAPEAGAGLREALEVPARPEADAPAEARDAAPVREALRGAPTPAERREALAARLAELDPERFGRVTAEDLALLGQLDLAGLPVHDGDVYLLAALPNLRRLDLAETPVTDAGLAHLAGSKVVGWLDLHGTQVTGAGLARLAPEPLQGLDLSDTRVVGDELAALPEMRRLHALGLNGLAFDDGDVEGLRFVRNLVRIELDRTTIGDDGLTRLMQLFPMLKEVRLRETQVSREFVGGLRGRYPTCRFLIE